MKKYVNSSYEDEEERWIDWGVDWSVHINGEEASWDDLTETEQDIILDLIRGGSYGGMF